MSNGDKHERKRACEQLQHVVKLLLHTEACYHTSLENYFEVEPEQHKQPCGSFCSSCDGSIRKSSGVFFRRALMSVLATNINGRSNVTPKALIKMLKSNKHLIFHKDHVPNTTMSQYHALALQLIAKGVIGLNVTENSKIGTNKISTDNIGIMLLNGTDRDGIILPAYMLDQVYDGLTTL